MMQIMSANIYLFALFSLAGWMIEFIFRSIGSKRLINPGFLRGPYLPIYGAGAVLIAIASHHLAGSSLMLKAVIYFVITTGIEFTTGYILKELFNISLWDYSKEFLRVRNHICLKYSFCWLIFAFVFEYYLLPYATALYHVIPYVTQAYLGLAGIMLIDAAFKFIPLFTGKRTVQRQLEDDDVWRDFSQIIEPLLKEPQVANLINFHHHRTITRLEHCLEVAWLSYVIARRLSSDYQAAARGAILHDLFFYEWLSEGPRLHGFRHPRICLENAKQVTVLTPKEEDIIIKHMWPLTISPPRYIESWIVCFVDTYCTIKDYATSDRDRHFSAELAK
jgi:uncharacterized protein